MSPVRDAVWHSTARRQDAGWQEDAGMPENVIDDGLFGPDGTADPPPARWYPDSVAGLTPGAAPALNLADTDEENRGVLAPAVSTPDAEAVREAMEAVLSADPEEGPAPPPRRKQTTRSAGARRESAQPGRLPTRPPRPGGGGHGWAANAASRQVARQQRAQRTKRNQPLRKQPAVLIVLALVLIVVFFNVLTALFNWLNSAFP